MKIFYLYDSNKLSHVRLISVFWAEKTFDSYFLDMMYVQFIKAFHFDDSNKPLLDSFPPPEPKNVWFSLSRHDVRRVHEKFFLNDSNKLSHVRHFSALWAQKTFFSYFLDMDVRSVHKNISLWRLEQAKGCWTHSGVLSQKSVWFLLSRHDVRPVHKSFSLRWFKQTNSC